MCGGVINQRAIGRLAAAGRTLLPASVCVGPFVCAPLATLHGCRMPCPSRAAPQAALASYTAIVSTDLTCVCVNLYSCARVPVCTSCPRPCVCGSCACVLCARGRLSSRCSMCPPPTSIRSRERRAPARTTTWPPRTGRTDRPSQATSSTRTSRRLTNPATPSWTARPFLCTVCCGRFDTKSAFGHCRHSWGI